MEAIKQYTKWRWVVHQPERIPEWIRQAYKVATVLPCGPTSVRIPRDLLYKENVSATVFSGSAFSFLDLTSRHIWMVPFPTNATCGTP